MSPYNAAEKADFANSAEKKLTVSNPDGRGPTLKETLEHLSPSEWKALYYRLRKSTQFYLYRSKAQGTILPDIDDFIHSAIEKTLSGNRNWPAGVPIVAFLVNVIRSEINHHVRSSYRKLSTSVEDDLIELIRDDRPNAEEVINSREIFDALMNSIYIKNDDTTISRILKILLEEDEAYSDHSNNNASIRTKYVARRLGLSADEVNNALRRLRRIAKTYVSP